MWWNVNKRLPLIMKYHNNPLVDKNLDMFFVSETCVGCNEYPPLKNYVVISDPKSTICSHGGI